MARTAPRIGIIGTGLAGSILADELAKWAQVTVFERGPAVPAHPERVVFADRPFGLHPSFCYGLGGTTNLWHGGMIAMTSAEYGSHWPAAVREDLPRWQDAVFERLYGRDRLLAWKALREAHSTLHHDPNLVLDYLFRPVEAHHAARSDSFRLAELRLGHRVTNLREDEGQVVVGGTASGRTFSLAFDHVVVAAGGLNSPLVLKASGLGGGQVGQNLTDHPMGFVAKLTRRPGSRSFDAIKRLPEAEGVLKMRDDRTGLWFSFYLRPTSTPQITSDPYADSFKILGSAGRLQQYFHAILKLDDADFRSQAMAHLFRRKRTGQHAYVLVVAQQEGVGQGTVEPCGPEGLSVRWSISDAVVEGLKRSLSRLSNWLDADLTVAPGDLRTRLWSAAHHSGTCRMAPSPAEGVVDTDLKVHGCNRIFVCDGSVLPATGVSNTGLTIGGLSMRLADHLRRVTEAPYSEWAPRDVTAEVLVTGAKETLGRVILPTLERAGIGWMSVAAHEALPSGPSVHPKALLNIANEAGSVQGNVELQRSIVEQAEAARIETVVMPMSFSTLVTTSPAAGDPSALNLGFLASLSDPYSLGKLESEKVWLEWQQAQPGRRLFLLYLPTVLGPNSDWTRAIAGYRPGLRLYVPRLDTFFSVNEAAVGEAVIAAMRDRGEKGVVRRAVLTDSGSLADAIALDRAGTTVHEVPFPEQASRLLEASMRKRKLVRLASIGMKFADRSIRLLRDEAIVPIAPEYLGLFSAQSRINPDIFESKM